MAAKLDPTLAAQAAGEAEEKFRIRREAVLESVAGDSDMVVPSPAPSLVYRPYQLAGIGVMVKRPFVLQADEMGLGKTIQVAGMINAIEQQQAAKMGKILIVCTNSLRLNWLDELKKWLVNYHTIAVWNSEVCRPAYVDISIIHYDVVWKWRYTLRQVQYDLTVGDECHVLKNPETFRARAVLGIDKRMAARLEKKRLYEMELLPKGAPIPKKLQEPHEILEPLRGRRAVMMTGTPLPNRPREGFPVFHYLDPVTYKSKSQFEREYCGAEFNGYGMAANGGSNLSQLQVLLRSTIMIRRLKQDVLKDLPAKQRSVIEMPHNIPRQVLDAEIEAYKAAEADLAGARAAAAAAKQSASENPEAYKAAVKSLRTGRVAVFSKISKQRKATAMAKIPYLIDHLRSLIDADEKLIVFVHHHELVDAIKKEFGRLFVTCYGLDKDLQRHANIKAFQEDGRIRGIVGSYQVMGVGHTLTASSHVVLGELDWVPGNVKQAEDRAHRIGQANSVLCEHLVLQGSLESHIARVVVEKLEMQAEALDMETPAGIGDTPTLAPAISAPGPARPSTPSPEPPRDTAPSRAPFHPIDDAEQVGFKW